MTQENYVYESGELTVDVKIDENTVSIYGQTEFTKNSHGKKALNLLIDELIKARDAAFQPEADEQSNPAQISTIKNPFKTNGKEKEG